MLKLNKDEWMYIHIPRTSGGNFKQIVLKYYEGENYIFSGNFNDINSPLVSAFWENYENTYVKTGITLPQYFNIAKTKLLYQIKHAPLSVWQKVGMYNNEQVITIVRNPYTRFVSHYYATIDILRQYFDFGNLSPIEFINHHNINVMIRFDPCNYKVNQIEYIKDINNNVKCDRIYKMETDLKTLEKDFKLKNINRFKYNKGEYDKNYSNFYTDELIQFVQETYKEDFEYFGYDKEPFW